MWEIAASGEHRFGSLANAIGGVAYVAESGGIPPEFGPPLKRF